MGREKQAHGVIPMGKRLHPEGTSSGLEHEANGSRPRARKSLNPPGQSVP